MIEKTCLGSRGTNEANERDLRLPDRARRATAAAARHPLQHIDRDISVSLDQKTSMPLWRMSVAFAD